MNQSSPALTPENALQAAEQFLKTIPPYPGRYSGRGIVIPGGGKYFTSAWIGIRTLRGLGCTLPIQLWYLGPWEMDEVMIGLLHSFGVECIDASAVRKQHPARILNGWELKAYSILNCPFQEVLLLDADNLATINPEALFDAPAYRDTGAIFWPDIGRLSPDRPIWKLCGIPYQDEPEFESGQIVLDKERCWEAMQLCMWYNENSDLFYRFVHGDKETFHLAFRKVEKAYCMPHTSADFVDPVFYQYDFEGNLVFQHRKKWDFFQDEPGIDLIHAEECQAYLEELRHAWDGQIRQVHRYSPARSTEEQRRIADVLTHAVFTYERIGYDSRPIAFAPDGTVGAGRGKCEAFWNLVEAEGQICLEIASETELTCQLRPDGERGWHGRWDIGEKMPVQLSPLPARLSWLPPDGWKEAQLHLPEVTLIAADSQYVDRTVRAMRQCLQNVRFKNAFLFTDGRPALPREITRVPIPRLASREAYSDFMLMDLPIYRDMFGEFVLVVQHDGFVLASGAWQKAFLEYDYIGAPWRDGAVGNGGFSLRSKRLLEALDKLRPEITQTHPEDEMLGRQHRGRLEAGGIRFAPTELARQFSVEDTRYAGSFGFHGARTERLSDFSLESLERKVETPDLPELFYRAKYAPSAIQKHIDTLRRLAKECRHITEWGADLEGATAAFLYAWPETLVAYYREHQPEITLLESTAWSAGIAFEGITALEPPLAITPTDLLFVRVGEDGGLIQWALTHASERVRRHLVLHLSAAPGTARCLESPAPAEQVAKWAECSAQWDLDTTLGSDSDMLFLKRRGA